MQLLTINEIVRNAHSYCSYIYLDNLSLYCIHVTKLLLAVLDSKVTMRNRLLLFATIRYFRSKLGSEAIILRFS